MRMLGLQVIFQDQRFFFLLKTKKFLKITSNVISHDFRAKKQKRIITVLFVTKLI